MKARKKPVEVEVVQFNGCNHAEVCMFTNNVAYPSKDKIIIPTLEGKMEAETNDWIIRGVNGEYYPCKPDIFEKTYDLMEGIDANPR